MIGFPGDFHFLRPLWLLALPPALWLAWACVRRARGAADWSRHIDPLLLAELVLPGGSGGRGRALAALLAAGWTLAVLGLAGPAWERLPEPVHRRADALVIALDLSLSMRAGDLAPSRLARARYKLNDLLATRRDGFTALVAYAGDAHVVTPLSDDGGTIAAMLPALEPAVMPVAGSDPVAAVRLALELLDGAGTREGRVLLVADALSAAQGEAIAALLQGRPVELSVLGVGTPEGAPVPLPDGGFARDNAGSIVVPGLDVAAMREAAAAAGGRYAGISLDDSDLRALLPPPDRAASDAEAGTERVFDRWMDRTAWVALLLLPLAALGLRRGVLLLVPLACLLLPAPRALALDWQDLWLRRDQQAARALAEGDAARAASLFRDPRWQGTANYEAGQYDAAAEAFARGQDASAHYNRGNALARAGRLQDALSAYDAALAQDPGLEDATANRRLVEDILRQQQQQQQQHSRDSGQGSQGQQPQDPGDGSQGQASQDTGQPQQDQSTGQPSGDDSSAGDTGATPQDPQGADDGADERARDGADASPQDAGKPADGDAKPHADAAEADVTGEATRDPADDDARAGATEGDAPRSEDEQAVEQWLRRVPDDPGALLRRKFEYESALRERRAPPGNR